MRKVGVDGGPQDTLDQMPYEASGLIHLCNFLSSGRRPLDSLAAPFQMRQGHQKPPLGESFMLKNT